MLARTEKKARFFFSGMQVKCIPRSNSNYVRSYPHNARKVRRECAIDGISIIFAYFLDNLEIIKVQAFVGLNDELVALYSTVIAVIGVK